MAGKQIRMAKIMDVEQRRAVIVPMDHGLSMGPVSGLVDMDRALDDAGRGGADAVVIHKGLVSAGQRNLYRDVGLIVHLSGSTGLCGNPLAKAMVCSVEEAIMLGADAVSVHVNLGNEWEKEMIGHLSQAAYDADKWGMPLLAMIYVRGENIRDEYDPLLIKHAARLGAELGADLVKVPYTGDVASFSEVTRGCPAPVVIAGGAKMDTDRDVLDMVHGAVQAGAAGLSIGRNVFQHENPAAMITAMKSIVYDGKSVDAALSNLCRPAKKAA